MFGCLVENYHYICLRESLIPAPIVSFFRRYPDIGARISRYGPDACALSMILLLLFVGTNINPVTTFYQTVLMPSFLALALILSVLQTDATRGGLWRYVNESRAMTMLGYCSYPIYLTQQVFLNFYARIIYDEVQAGKLNNGDYYSKVGDNWWFGNRPWWTKPIGFICLFAICWPIQRYFQDTLVISFSSKILLWCSRRNVHGGNSKFSNLTTA